MILMSFHDSINELVVSFKDTQEYKEYLQLKQKLKQKDFQIKDMNFLKFPFIKINFQSIF